MAIRKEMLRRRGAIAHAAVRLPAPPLDASTREALDRLLAWVGKTREKSWTSA
jgi:4-hydroxy-tetrahydrodipicolinate synthase